MTEHILQFFSHDHLPEHLKAVSCPFATLAHSIVEHLPRNPERTVALRKLLEAKDCAVRALLAVEEPTERVVLDVAATDPAPKPTRRRKREAETPTTRNEDTKP